MKPMKKNNHEYLITPFINECLKNDAEFKEASLLIFTKTTSIQKQLAKKTKQGEEIDPDNNALLDFINSDEYKLFEDLYESRFRFYQMLEELNLVAAKK
jgi:hypothetical protein